MQLASDDTVLDTFAALDLDAIALLLDVDGTIIDIGPTPSDVHVPADLTQSLARLDALTGHAVALVSGRPIADLDGLFSPLTLSSIGVHGAEMRVRGARIERGSEPLPDDMRRHLARVAGGGVIVEDKGYSLALHFRGAPGREAELHKFASSAIEAADDDSIELLRGKSLIEIRRTHVNKGEGVTALMSHAPFRGRVPVFIGDDVTDEDVFKVLPKLRGKGYSVGRKFSGLAGIFHSPADVREALARLAERRRPQ